MKTKKTPSARLTHKARREIRDLILRNRRTEEKIDTKPMMHQLAEDIYKNLLGDDYKKIQKMPKNWFPSQAYIGVNFVGVDSYAAIDFANNMELPFPFHAYQDRVKLAKTHKLHKQFVKIKKIESDFRLKENELHEQIWIKLCQVNTTRDLIKAWPEIADVVRQVVDIPFVEENIVLDTADINQSLGLSVKAKK